ILDLKDHLSRPLKLAAPLEGVGFEYGINTNYLRTLVKYWRDDYLPRWTDRQNYLNSFPQYKTKIQGLDIHFIHIKPQQKSKDILPLILLHGWPGSVREYYGLISELISGNHEKYDFELIVPSLPGFGWSQASSKKGLSPSAMAVIFKNLMKRLGHEKFLIQGGDFGAIIGSHLATLYPDSVIGVHSNMCGVNGPSSVFKWMFASVFPTWFVTSEQISFHFPISSYLSKVIEETGHLHIHSTKPDTIGTVFSRNPVGLLAYFVEKFATWTNPEFKKFEDGNLEKKFKLDDLFDNIMIYYLTNSITTSQRIYAESFAKTEMALQLDNIPTRFLMDVLGSNMRCFIVWIGN
uniref:Epoxide hydrolase n=1 Tax=Megaselia scalaris TaxID=36166 RepID=T1GZZ4_MEGSC